MEDLVKLAFYEEVERLVSEGHYDHAFTEMEKEAFLKHLKRGYEAIGDASLKGQVKLLNAIDNKLGLDASDIHNITSGAMTAGMHGGGLAAVKNALGNTAVTMAKKKGSKASKVVGNVLGEDYAARELSNKALNNATYRGRLSYEAGIDFLADKLSKGVELASSAF